MQKGLEEGRTNPLESQNDEHTSRKLAPIGMEKNYFR